MCVKLPPEDLNPGPYPSLPPHTPHPTPHTPQAFIFVKRSPHQGCAVIWVLELIECDCVYS